MSTRRLVVSLLRRRFANRSFNAQKAITLFALGTLIISMLAYYLGALGSWQQSQAQALAQLKTRIALDSTHIGLAYPLLEVPADIERTKAYIEELNTHLTAQGYPLQLQQIGTTTITNKVAQQRLLLQRPGAGELTIGYSLTPMPLHGGVSALPLLLSIFAALFIWPWFKAMEEKLQILAEAPEPLVEKKSLLLDLSDKSIRYGEHGDRVTLANKPLCFYLALLEFAIEHPTVTLNQNKDVPAELLDLAHKYFSRLIELGHTIRKRPNFSNSLEKTLSEIRAALDEVFAEDAEQKEPYFPPKAHGEGSRSRVHHYGLSIDDASAFDVIGR
ncbi:hypothetical protein [Pseudoalteromonas sp. BDTF-M6]|uniref:hypothetical protein n=1 Tax=Pseudoalteromonas sp. BDTF-M6 TaxID=2796132 RepID=UPI001BAF2DBB|nr:hypothetical protein [Pseudoalteromonas sp. BDTF-M6]MBS3797759.1 hypothetical protein [Pseudoalteromonas sp. BDTF-M6]